jgi:hypothetical protein
VQQLDPKYVAGVSDVSPHPIEQRADFAEAVFRTHGVPSKYLDRFLPHVKVLGASLDQAAYELSGDKRSALSPGYA